MREISGRQRPRKTLACVLCRSRKVKCSGESTCQGCLARGIECVYIDGKKRGPPLGYVRKKVNERPVLQQTTQIPKTIISSFELDHSVFRKMTFEDEDGSRLLFIDYYFKWAHRELPFLSKDWVENNFDLLPPYLLHAMYAKITITPLTRAKLESKLYLQSYKFAKKILMSDCVDGVDPFMICALIHLGNVAALTLKLHELPNLLSLTLSGAIHLGFHLDQPPVWTTNAYTTITDINFCRSMWFYIYAFGYQGSAVYDLPIADTPDITFRMIDDFVSPNRNHPTNIPQNALSYYYLHIPLVTIGRKIKRYLIKCTDFNPKLLEQLDSWYACLPIIYKAHDNMTWLGRYLANLNMVYHYQRFTLLKQEFLIKIESGDVNSGIVIESKASVLSIAALNKAFIASRPIGIDEKSVMHNMVTYMAGIVCFAIASVTGENITGITKLFIETSKLIDTGPDFGTELEKCLGDYKLAIGMLKRFKNSTMY